MLCSSRWSRVWLRCVSLAAILLLTTSHEPEHYGSESGSGISLFPTATVVGFEQSTVFVRESNKSAELCAVVYEPFEESLPEIFNVMVFTEDGRAKAGEDYRAVLQALGPFNNTHRRLCVEVPFIDDMLCESNPYPEDFTATMVTTNLNVTVTPSKIGVAVDDRFEPECVNVCVGFDKPVYNTIEEIGYIRACVEILCPDHVVEREVFVTISTHGNSAEADRDYVPLTAVTVGPLGHYTTRRCVPIVIINDGDCERRAERFYLTLETDESLVSFTNNNAQVVIDGTTEQDDCASVRVGFLQAHYTAREGDGGVTVCVGAFEPQRFGANFNVMADTKDGTAIRSSDYIPLKDVEVGPFNQGSRLQCFAVQVINDGTCGDDSGRFFTITLTTYADLVSLSPQRTRVYVYDAVECIQVHLGMDITTFSVQEDELMARMCATVFRPPVLERQVEAFINTRDGSAEEGVDYLALVNHRITFSEENRYVCFNITIMNDAKCEEYELFTILLSSSAQRVVVTPSFGYVIIHDPPFCTGVQAELEPQFYATYEGAESVEVCANITVVSLREIQPFSLLVSTQDGSAKAPSDYIALIDEMVGPFNGNNTEACFAISIVQDSVCEGDVDSSGVPMEEVFNVVMRSEEGSGVEVLASGRVATIVVEDSAVCIPVVLGFEQSSYTVREMDGSVILCVNVTEPAVLRREVTLTVVSIPGTATDSDYESISQSLGPFSDDQRRLCVTLVITDDGQCDTVPVETLTVQLTGSDPNITLTPATATVVILDSPQCTPSTVTFEQSKFISSEELGLAVLCASVSGPPPTSSFSLAISTYDDTANAGEDYVSISQDLTFQPDSTRECVVVLLVQDEVCESTMTESFGVRLTNRENGNTVQDTATVVIYDASECITVTVQFEEVVYSLREGSGRVQVCVEITSPPLAEREFLLMVTSVNRDAVAGEDYTQLVGDPLGPFSNSQRRLCRDVVVIDDSVCEEPEESFILSLTTEEKFIDISRDSVTVYIEDAEEVECVQVNCGFESTAYVVQETVGQVEACVSVPSSQVLQFDFNLTIATVDASATGGQDFISVNELLMFGPGQQRRCVFITVLNDQECEDRPNEKFTVVIQGEDRRCVLRPNVLTITIDDLGQFDSVTDPDCFPLEIYFTGDSPRVGVGSVEIELATRGRSLPQTITCDLINRRGSVVQTMNCTNGSALFSNIRQKGYYFIKATVITGRNSAKTERRVRIDRNAMACSAHLINRGLSIAAGGRATAEFAGVGPVDSFRCTLNGETLSDPCASPLQLSGLESHGQQYTLRVIPAGTRCTVIKKLKKKFVYVEPYAG